MRPKKGWRSNFKFWVFKNPFNQITLYYIVLNGRKMYKNNYKNSNALKIIQVLLLTMDSTYIMKRL